MSVFLQSNLRGKSHPSPKGLPVTRWSGKCPERSSTQLTIGLINNMPDSALEATERQFISLLNSASEGLSVRLRLYSIRDIPRGEIAAAHIATNYTDVERMWDDSIDALIVTGREPLSANLRNEPYWQSFIRLLEWARDNTRSTVWSCLAAHAAVLHMDGIARVRSDRKHCGLFECMQETDHILTSGAPLIFRLPHSRWNGLNETELVDSGYTILTRTEQAGVDTFVKHAQSLFVFFQGHPEYDPHTLLLEYRRDAGRYLRGETAEYPTLPLGYFDHDTSAALLDIGDEARQSPREELLGKVSSILQGVTPAYSWRATATRIYANWLGYLLAEKLSQKNGATRSPRAPGNAVIGADTDTPSLPILTHCIS